MGCTTCDGSGWLTLFTTRERCPECEDREFLAAFQAAQIKAHIKRFEELFSVAPGEVEVSFGGYTYFRDPPVTVPDKNQFSGCFFLHGAAVQDAGLVPAAADPAPGQAE